MSEDWDGNSECRCTKHHAPKPVSVTLVGDTPVCSEMVAQINEIHRRWDNKGKIVKTQATGFHRFARELAETSWVNPSERQSEYDRLADIAESTWNTHGDEGMSFPINSPGTPGEDEATHSGE